MDQERNTFESQAEETLHDDVFDAAPVGESEDAEEEAIRAEAEQEKAELLAELEELDRRLELEFTMLGKRAFEFAQTDNELASRLGVALAAVTAQNERKSRLSRSLEAMDKKTEDRLADLRHARAAKDQARVSEEDLARKVEAAREAMERARELEQEAEEARHVRESAQHEADAAALAASRTMLLSFTDDTPEDDAQAFAAVDALVQQVASEGCEDAQPQIPAEDDASQEEPVPEAASVPAFDQELDKPQELSMEEGLEEGLSSDEPLDESLSQDESAPVEEQFVSDLSPALQAMFGSVPFPETIDESQESAFEPASESDLEPERESDSAWDVSQDTAEEPESQISEQQVSAFTTEPAAEPEQERDPNATLLLSDFDDQRATVSGFADEPVRPGVTLMLDEKDDSAGTDEAKCPACGSSVHEGELFCMSCGSKLDRSEPLQEVSESEPSQHESIASASQPNLEDDSSGLGDDAPMHEDPIDRFVSEYAPAHAAPQAWSPSAEPVSVRCQACGAEIQAGDKFCMRCGARQDQMVAPVAPQPPVASGPVCLNCGFELQPGDKFCMRCGTPVQQVPTPQVPTTPVAHLCPHCGAEYSETDKFCMMCGNAL